MHHLIDGITHTTTFVKPVVEHWQTITELFVYIILINKLTYIPKKLFKMLVVLYKNSSEIPT